MEILPVSAVLTYLKDMVEMDAALGDLWIAGEASNVTRSAAGHTYFTVKDALASLRCVKFKGRGRSLPFQNGDSIVVHGKMSVYEARGEIQLYADLVQFEGVGELQLQFEQLKNKLEQEGLFEESRKRPLPRFPERIGVVTSPTGAVIHDIQNVLRRRYPLVDIVLAPCLVQGDGAAKQIAAAIEQLNLREDVDLIVVARGGGSIEDLWAFNEEIVARAIFASRLPVVSAVGHETDVTIADFVADLRAPTPSAAAELLAPDVADLQGELQVIERFLTSTLNGIIGDCRSRLGYERRRLARSAPELGQLRLKIDEVARRLQQQTSSDLALRRERLNSATAQLAALSPAATLQRGFAVVESLATQEVVSDAGRLSPGDRIGIRFARGSAEGKVEAVLS